MKDQAVIAASNIVSSIISSSQTAKEIEEVLAMYDQVYDHIVCHLDPKKEACGVAKISAHKPLGY